MSEYPVTVISMAYNKALTIERTYKSLRNQTSYQFEWLIVNDGSKDNIKEVVSSFTEDLFPIRFIDKENEGPARTWNRAVKEARGDLLFRVDPDDFVTSDAIEQIIKHKHLVDDTPSICGLVFLSMFENGDIVGYHPFKEDTRSNFMDYRIRWKATGDRAEVITRTAAMEFPWPFIDGEKFMLEGSFWTPMGMKYDAMYINRPIYIREYTLNSITGASNATYINNPLGVMELNRILLKCYRSAHMGGVL